MSADEELDKVRRIINGILMTATFIFLASMAVIVQQYINLNREAFESRWFPPATDWTFRDWRVNDDDQWTVVVYVYKARPECVYVRGQVTTLRYVTPDGRIGETRYTFEGDTTPGNNRTLGWQRLDDNIVVEEQGLPEGTRFRGSILHRCTEDSLPTASTFQGVIAGQDDPWPPYVQQWIDNDRLGGPDDYR